MEQTLLSNNPAHILYLDLDTADARQVARLMLNNPLKGDYCVHIDCRHLCSLKTRGYCHVISQLLELRASGARVLLRNVSCSFYSALSLFKLTNLFDIRRNYS
jgi:hypothetical protein